MPRPHSPDCVLWAKNLKDEHGKLKARIAELEKANESRVSDASEPMNGTGLSTEDNDTQNDTATRLDELKHQTTIFEGSVARLSARAAKLEQDMDEMREEQRRTSRSSAEIASSVRMLEQVTVDKANSSAPIARKNDPNDPRVLLSLVQSIQSQQTKDSQTIQSLLAKVRDLEYLATNPACSQQELAVPRGHLRPATTPLVQGMLSEPRLGRTPLVHETSSPVIMFSPLAEKQLKRYPTMSTLSTTTNETASQYKRPRRSPLHQPGTVKRQTAIRGGRHAMSASTRQISETPDAEEWNHVRGNSNKTASEVEKRTSMAATPSRKRKAGAEALGRNTRSRADSFRVEDSQSMTPRESPPFTPEEGSALEGLRARSVMRRSEMTEKQGRRTKVGLRGQRTITQTDDLPPLDQLSD